VPPPYPDRPIQFRHHDRRIPLPQPPATAAARYAAARYRSREILAAPAASLLAPATCAQPSTQRAARSRTNPRLLPRASRSCQPAPAHQRANAPATCAHLPATCAHPPATPPPRSAQPPLPPSPRRAAASAPAFFPAQRAAAPNPAQRSAQPQPPRAQPPRAQPAHAQPPPTPRNAARRRSRHARSRLHPNNHARSSPPHAHV
jgi:hypothetical protein